MSITVTIVENINEVLKTSTIAANGEDVMMTRLRNNIAKSKNWSSVIVEVVLYFILTVFTVIFTVQYFRRTIYLAFLTVIAPLITLTYPLDKIKDSKSQAFDMWIRDYMFFMLLQVVQLLIYYILVGSSLDLADKGNWIFAIVAISFLVPAEKLIKEMFGIKSSTPVGTLGAAAGGAMVMSMLNKMKAKPPKGEGKDGSGSGAPKGVRTATRSSSGSTSANENNETGAEAVAGSEGGVPTVSSGPAPVMAANAANSSSSSSSGDSRNKRWNWSRFKCIRKKIYIWSR